MTVQIPVPFLAFAGRGAGWNRWLGALPRLVADVLRDWDLRVDGAALTGQCSLVVPVLTAEGDRAVVKFGWPHEEAEHEHLALREWGGDGAVRLLRANPRRAVLLLERADATRDLTSLPALEACEVVAGFYPRLHRPAVPQLRLLSAYAARWAGELQAVRGSTQVPRRYVDQAASLARDFAADAATDGLIVHTDLHYFNVLASVRQPWLVIDPKPISGDPTFEVAPLLWNRWDEAAAGADVRIALQSRFYAVVDVAGFDEQRARDWVVVRMMVNVMRALDDLKRGLAVDVDWLTTCITIVKAIQR